MCCTIEDFKTAFTEQDSSGDLQCQDELVAAALKRLKSLITSAAKSGVADDGDSGRLTGLVKRYDAARKQNGSAPRETAAEFRSIREEARNRTSHFERVLAAGTPPTHAGNPGRSAAPSPSTAPDTQPQQQPKQAYDFGFALLKPRLPTTSQPGSAAVATIELELFDIRTRMEAAAAAGDYNTALTLLRELEAKLAEYEAAQAERQRKKQEYERRLPAVQPRADAVVRDSAAGKYPQLAVEQQEIVRLYDQMKQAAGRGDYEQALKLLTTLEGKLTAYDTDADGIPNAIDSDDDNDRVPDYQDSAPTDATRSRDTDGDGIDDSTDDDIDNDGIKNAADDDDDGDGNSDAFEDRVNASLERLRTRNDPLLNRVLDTAINNRLDRNGDGDKRDTDLFDRAVGLSIGGETSGIGDTDMRLGDCAVNQRDVDFDGTVAHESAHATQRSMLPGNDADGDTLPDTIPAEFRGTEFDRIRDPDSTTRNDGMGIREREAQRFETSHTGSRTGECEAP